MNSHSRGIGHNDVSFDISPAGDTIVFNGIGAGGFDLYQLRLADLRVSRVAETPAYETTPTFTPDGESLVYAAGLPGDRADHLFICKLDGSGRRQLTSADANDSLPRVSPDGSLVVFSRNKSYHWGGLAHNWSGGVICVVGLDGQNERQLTADDDVAWSAWFLPDGQTVAYETQAGIFTLQLDGSATPKRLADLPAGDQAVSPAEQYFVYTRGQYSGSQELLIANRDGTDERRLLPKLGAYYLPRFAPQDNRVYFCKEEWPDGPSGTPRFSLWRVDLDGQNLQRVADRRLFDQPLSWKPSGG
ncbi:MAG: PD40 domain-containing protein [Planctomycetes bacterium]|nr:PD40 domain-containing protein [Planctomycetota bacterium]